MYMYMYGWGQYTCGHYKDDYSQFVTWLKWKGDMYVYVCRCAVPHVQVEKLDKRLQFLLHMLSHLLCTHTCTPACTHQQQCTAVLGSTDLWRPLRSLQLLSDGDPPPVSRGDTTTLPPRSVFIVSDGHITEEEPTLSIIRQGCRESRVFTIGVRWAWRIVVYFADTCSGPAL